MEFERTRTVLERAVRERACPAAVAEVGSPAGVLWRHAAGRLTDDPGSAPAGPDTVFDLASLTKVVATTTLVMSWVEAGRLALDERVGAILAWWSGSDRERVTVFDLLAHSSGLPATRPLWESCRSRLDVEAALATCPLDYDPGSKSVYSDLGFILLGFLVERLGRRDLSAQFGQSVLPVMMPAGDPAGPPSGEADSAPAAIQYLPPRSWRERTAPTGFDAWRGRVLDAEVHDGNAWVLGGVAGHAGLFGTAPAVGAFARAMLSTVTPGAATGPAFVSPALASRFVTRAGTHGSSRALGWDTMLPTSSCGTRLSARSIGHTGFTGTSLWIDLDRQLYMVLLTNRVSAPGDAERFGPVRPAFHEAVVEDLEQPLDG